MQRETIPDEVVRRADQIELVDMSPHALRQRMKHGNVYPPERTQVALEKFFTEANLTALDHLMLDRREARAITFALGTTVSSSMVKPASSSIILRSSIFN